MRTRKSKTLGAKATTGVKQVVIRKGARFSLRKAAADDPIYTRGFAIGFTMGGPAWPRAAATASSVPNTPPPPMIDSTEPQNDAHKSGQ